MAWHLLVTVPEGKWKWEDFHSMIVFFEKQAGGYSRSYKNCIHVERKGNTKEKMVRRALREEIRRRSPHVQVVKARESIL